MTAPILIGDCRDVLRTLPDESVHCVVTSPPYFGLRDYGVAGQIGLEATPAAFVEEMVAVFREVRRVLRSDGTVWLNLGDSYASASGNKTITAQTAYSTGRAGGDARAPAKKTLSYESQSVGFKNYGALKQKDLVGIPWRVAFALQADGWYLRQDIIWSKPNPMPESVRDRCTKAHEYIFLLSKSARYYYDADSISEQASEWSQKALAGNWTRKTEYGTAEVSGRNDPGANYADRIRKDGRRNKRSVWEVASQPFPESHFATFPPTLIEPCILAGCPKGGTVLDPFGGAGTTALVADRLGRNSIIIELNPDYAEMAERRIRGDAGMFADVGKYDAGKDFAGSLDVAYDAIRVRTAAGGPGWPPDGEGAA